MSTNTRVNWNKVITPLHPKAPQGFTVHDCFHIARITGVNPQTLAGIMMGRILPAEFIASRLKPHFSDGTIGNIISDYDPERFYNFKEKGFFHPSSYNIEEWYPVENIKAGDCIRCDDGKWLIVSDVIKHKTKVRIFSGGVFCVSLPANNHLIVAVSLNDNFHKNKGKKDYSDRENIREAIRNFDDEERKRKMVQDMIDKLRE